MDDPGFIVYIVDTRTGNIALDVPYLDTPEFTRQLNTDGDIRVRIPLGDPSCPTSDRLRQLVVPWRFSLAVAWGSSILAIGPIMTYQFDHANMILSVGAGSIWALLARRLLINDTGVLGTPLSMDPSQDANFGPLSLHSIARGLLSEMFARGATYQLPIDLPASIAGTATRNYPIYDLASVGDRLKDLTQVQGGPDIDWDPYFNVPGQNIRINMRIGNPTLSQVGLDLLWDDNSGLTHTNVDSNGAQLSTGVFTRGNSTERATQAAYSTDTSLVSVGWPPLEYVDSTHQSVVDLTTLQGHADEWIRFYKKPIEVWQVEVQATVSPVIGTYKPGDLASFNMREHPWIPAGSYQQRILGWQNAGPSRLRLILEAREGAV